MSAETYKPMKWSGYRERALIVGNLLYGKEMAQAIILQSLLNFVLESHQCKSLTKVIWNASTQVEWIQSEGKGNEGKELSD